MSDELDTFLDYLFQMWAIQFPTALVLNLIFYVLFLVSNANTLVDFGWAFNQMVFTLSIMLQQHDSFTLKYGFILILVFIWFFRLGGFLFFTRVIKQTNDTRYEEMSGSGSETKRKCWFLFQFLFQALLVILPASPIFFMFRKPDEYRWNFYTGIVIALFGIIMEAIADQQLYNWIENKKKKRKDTSDEEILQKNEQESNTFRGGLWKTSRHPNLFFEFIAWIGFAIIGMNDLISLVGLVGPFTLLLLMYFVTIPITERSMKSRRPNWTDYESKTNRLLPVC